jgi:hypothetical protein
MDSGGDEDDASIWLYAVRHMLITEEGEKGLHEWNEHARAG